MPRKALLFVLLLVNTAAEAVSKVPSPFEALAAQTAQAYAALALESSDNSQVSAGLLRREGGHARPRGHDSLVAMDPPDFVIAVPRKAPIYDVAGRPIQPEKEEAAALPSSPPTKKPDPVNLSTPKVWCGGHTATTCEECSRHGKGKTFCNGDCRWEPEREECVYRADLVWCGAHAAESCQACAFEPDGTRFVGKGWCNGECYWESAEFEGGLYGHLAEPAWWTLTNRGSGQCVSKYPNPPPYNEFRRRRTEAAITLKDMEEGRKTTDGKRKKLKKLPMIARTDAVTGKTSSMTYNVMNAETGLPNTVQVYYGGSVERRNTSELEKIFRATAAMDATLADQPTFNREDGRDDLQAIAAFKVIAFLIASTLGIAFIFLVLSVSHDAGYDATYRRRREEAGLPKEEG